MKSTISIVVCAYNMPRELPRTIRSLSPGMQRGVERPDYDLIVVDNGSTLPFSEDDCRKWGADLRVIRIPPGDARQSPVHAINIGISEARGDLIGVFIDGARMASPGIIAFAGMAARAVDRAVVLTLGFHLGPKIQMESIRQGYDQAQEDRLLAQADWTTDGYRLFDIAVLAGSSQHGWFQPLAESNAMFLGRDLWSELGGFDERFQAPAGGLANLDTLSRAVKLPRASVITLLGEGTFHQIHGGAATNALCSPWDVYHAEYKRIRGHEYERPTYRSAYIGGVLGSALERTIGDDPLTLRRF